MYIKTVLYRPNRLRVKRSIGNIMSFYVQVFLRFSAALNLCSTSHIKINHTYENTCSVLEYLI